MSEKLTPEQIAAITQVIEQHLKQNVTAQQEVPEGSLIDIVNQIPGLITNLITGPTGAAVGLVGTLINTSLDALVRLITIIGGSNLAPELVNIIKQQVPTAPQAPAQQPKQSQ